MRKTLAVLALMISSMLFLQAPAWAPPEEVHHLIKIKPIGSYEALTDCPRSSVVRIRPNPAAGVVRAKTAGTKAFGGKPRNRFTFDTGPGVRFSPAKLRATCDNKLMKNDPGFLGPKVPLAFTGRSLVPQLLLGTGLLLAGAILLVLTGQLPTGVLRRRRPGPATPS
jgi:hypothetical protein